MIKTKTIILIMIPAITMAAFALFLGISQYEPIYEKTNNNKNALDFIPIFSEDLIIGRKNAAKTIITFEDFGCDSCQTQMQIFNELTIKYPTEVKIILKTLDITAFPQSSAIIHSYAYCANQQGKFIDFEKEFLKIENIDLDSIKNYASLVKLDIIELEKCLNADEQKQSKEKNAELARVLQIQSVPTTFINNEAVQEPLTLDGWKSLLSIP